MRECVLTHQKSTSTLCGFTVAYLYGMVSLEMNATYENDHHRIDRRSLALDVAVQREFLKDPARVRQIAVENLERWAKQGFESLPNEDWMVILETLSDEELSALLIDESEKATELRQSSPFVGIITEEGRLEIFRKYERVPANSPS